MNFLQLKTTAPEKEFIIKTNGNLPGDDFIAMCKEILNYPDHQPDKIIDLQ